jgi:predicted lactoylglutathione lyase
MTNLPASTAFFAQLGFSFSREAARSRRGRLDL